MKKNTKTKSEPKSGRAGLLGEHDRIEQKLARLRAMSVASDETNTKTIEKATAIYTAAANKAQAAFDASITKAQKALRDATEKANRVNNKERDDIAAKNGPLKRRLQFLKAEVRREFVVADGTPCRTASECFQVAGTSTGRYTERPVRYPYETRMPEGEWVRGPIWERMRVGDMIRLRRVG